MLKIRRDWLDELGLDVRYTTEFKDAIQAFQDNDVNGNGSLMKSSALTFLVSTLTVSLNHSVSFMVLLALTWMKAYQQILHLLGTKMESKTTSLI